MATVARVAQEAGVGASTIRRNAQIHETFFEGQNVLSAENILEDKQFYTEALRAADPVAAIEVIAAKQAVNPEYTTRDAQRDVSAMKTGRTSAARPLPTDTYSLILADPPWQYDFSVSESRAWTSPGAAGGGRPPSPCYSPCCWG